MNNTVEIIEIMKDFEGIIGAILGSVSTLIVTDFLRKKGILKTYLMKYVGIYYTNAMGEIRPIEDEKDKIMYLSLKYKIQVYNRSDTTKIMRNFKVVFIKDKKIVYSFVPNNEATRVFSTYSYKIEEMEVSNVIPREIQVLDQSGYVSDEYIDLVEGSNKIELHYYDEKDRKRRVLLYKGVLSKTDYQPKLE
nr:hypothetical protein [uncultured Lachnoclostridium sp.]